MTTHPVQQYVVQHVRRQYRTDSAVTGVKVPLPPCVRVEHVAHDVWATRESQAATLEYDEERRDYLLTKLEAVPGIREVSSPRISPSL